MRILAMQSALRAGFDLVLNRTNLAAKKREEGAEEDQGADLRYSQKFLADVSNSTLLYYKGKDEFKTSKQYSIEDITTAISDTLKAKGWDVMKKRTLDFLGESE